MPKKAVYAVRETVTLVWFVDAETDEEARDKARNLEIRDFEEVDCSPAGAAWPRTVERLHDVGGR